jgi:hypothetical protein
MDVMGSGDLPVRARNRSGAAAEPIDLANHGE